MRGYGALDDKGSSVVRALEAPGGPLAALIRHPHNALS